MLTKIRDELLDKLYLLYASEDFTSNFPKALILNCVADVCAPEFKHRIVNELLSSMNPLGTVNYYICPAEFPDDLDDTACTYLALYRADKDLLTGELGASLAKILTHCEVTCGGPYFTWAIQDHSKNDIDPIVNANIAYLLQCLNIKLPKLLDFLSNCILTGDFESPYYIGEIPAFYFFSRVNLDGVNEFSKSKYLKIISDQAIATFNIQDLALLLTSGIELNIELSVLDTILESLVSKLCMPIQTYPLVIERKGNHSEYLTSLSLTAAFICEALSKYLKFTAIVSVPKKCDLTFYKDKLRIDLAEFPPKVVDIVLNKYFISRIVDNFANELIDFGCSAEDLYISMLGWFAYSIYDQIFDEKKDGEFLPIVNFIFRKIYLYFGRDQVIIFDQMDVACLKEISSNSNEKYFDLSILYKKSFGCVLPFLNTLKTKTLVQDSSDVSNLVKLFRHYLIIKQLNDDAHDWEEDRANNSRTYPLFLLKRIAKGNNVDFRRVFWHKVFPKLLHVMSKHLTKTEKYMQRIDIRIDVSPLKNLLDVQRRSLELAKSERNHVLDFLAAYSMIK